MASRVLTPINPTPSPALSNAPGSTNPDVRVVGAPPAAPIQHPEQLVKMWGPDAKPGDAPEDVYAERAHDAVLAGGTIAVPFIAPDGSRDFVALHKVPDAIKAGGHIDDKVINSLSDNSGVTGVGSGIAKGAIDTMRGAANAMGGAGTSERVGLPNVSTAPTGLSEKIGRGAESVLEFLLGDETLNGLSLGEKLGKIAPIVKSLESHPSLAKLVGGAVRGATVGGAQGAVKGAADDNALGGAVTGATLGAAGGAVAEVPGAIRAAGAAGVGAEGTAAPSLISKAVKGEKVAQPAIRQALKTAAQSSIEDAGVSDEMLPASHGASVRSLLDNPIEALSDKERATYDALNKAAGTDLKSLYDHAEDLQSALDDPTNISQRTALQNELTTTQTAIQQGEGQAVKNGVSPDSLNRAKSMTQQRYAMEDVARKIFNNESVVRGNIEYGHPEEINVDAAIRQAETLNKPSKFAPRGTPSRLQQALGSDGSNRLLSELYDARKTGARAVAIRKVAGWLGAATGAGILGHQLLNLIGE